MAQLSHSLFEVKMATKQVGRKCINEFAETKTNKIGLLFITAILSSGWDEIEAEIEMRLS